MRSIKEIKELRLKHKLTQKELSKKTGISQGMIAKIESGKVEPSYHNVMNLFNYLDSLKDMNELTAEQIMNRKFVSSAKDEKLKDIAKKMYKYDILSIAVVDDKKVIGYVTSSKVLDEFYGNRRKEIKAEDIMFRDPPFVSKNMGFKALRELLKNSPIVVVSEKEKVLGTVSRREMLAKGYKTLF